MKVINKLIFLFVQNNKIIIKVKFIRLISIIFKCNRFKKFLMKFKIYQYHLKIYLEFQKIIKQDQLNYLINKEKLYLNLNLHFQHIK